MGKKKIIGLCLAVGLMVGVVGGSLAWFIDTDQEVNSFTTQGNNEGETNGIDIIETWNPEHGKNIFPGADVNKDVKVKNTASYDQFIRVKFTKTSDKAGLDLKAVDLRFTDFDNNKWEKVKEKDAEWYYYTEVVKSDEETTKLLDSVKLLNSAGIEYKGVAYDVIVDAEGIQAVNGAVSAAWPNAPQSIRDLGGELVAD